MMTLPYDYMPALLNVFDLISQGYTETAACDHVKLSISTFKHYIKNNEELQEMYDEAFQRGTDAMADALLNPDNHALYGHSDAKMAKVQSDNIKWFLSKRRPKDFGDRIEVNHHLTADKAITQALLAARNRVPLLEDVEEADFIDVTPEPSDEELMAELGLI